MDTLKSILRYAKHSRSIHTRQQEIPLTGKQLVATLGATLLALPADAGNEQAIW